MSFSRLSRIAVIALLLLLLPGGSTAAPGIRVALGETVPLSGYSYDSPRVYLFLTGPNLPVNGVPLNDITKRADQGQFTRIEVDSNDRWSYQWNTAAVGGRLDEGTYTVWVVNGPNDVSRLAQADYRTISVTLGKPYVAVVTGQQNGALEITSVPSGTSVTLNEQYRGTTPLSIQDLTPGTYRMTVARTGYQEVSIPVIVGEGRVSEISVTLEPVQKSPSVTLTAQEIPTTPALLPSQAPTPASAGMLPALPLAGVFLAWGALRRYP